MKVFISWSGDRSKQLGTAIHWWLPKVLNFVDVFFSDSDIESGARWYNSIIDALEKSDAGLVILTPENITGQRWMMFEVGAIARSVTQARVCPILFGITKTDLNLKGGPLSFFQAAEFSVEDDFRKLQKTINAGRLGEAHLTEVFDAWWSKLKEKIDAIPALPQTVLETPKADELLQEILFMTRGLVLEQQKLVQALSTLPTVMALLRQQRLGLGRALNTAEAEAEMAGTAAAVLDGLTVPKSE
jgi:hypothetical protein